VCGGPLAEHLREFVCGSGHRFDRAREGYVNLLPGGRIAGGASGDDDAMVRARRAVFDAGAYAPIVVAVAESVAGAAPSAVLDAGCGEGSYLAATVAASGASGWGIDISKAAVRLAARRHRSLRFAVASSYRLPFADATFGAVIDVFSPRPFDELLRVLVPGGVAIVVTPGAGHLAQLKSMVYDDPRSHRETSDVSGDAPVPETTSRVTFTVDLADPARRLALLEMTPYWWSTSPERRDRIAAALHAVDADMVIRTYRR
jgi:23S rRNA (guanine745-N1)-methyltransferase